MVGHVIRVRRVFEEIGAFIEADADEERVWLGRFVGRQASHEAAAGLE
jgi:hypothetical protein